jgi:hypothetical protein
VRGEKEEHARHEAVHRHRELIDAIYADRTEVPIEVQVKHQDGRVETKKTTLMIMENQAQFMEALSKNPQLEATFTSNLGALVPRVIDLVRIFYYLVVKQAG